MASREVIIDHEEYGVINKPDGHFILVKSYGNQWSIIEGIENHGQWAALGSTIDDINEIRNEVIKFKVGFSTCKHNKLIPVQCRAMKLITGPLSTAAGDIHYVHANLLPINLLYHKILFCAAVHLASLPSSQPHLLLQLHTTSRNTTPHYTPCSSPPRFPPPQLKKWLQHTVAPIIYPPLIPSSWAAKMQHSHLQMWPTQMHHTLCIATAQVLKGVLAHQPFCTPMVKKLIPSATTWAQFPSTLSMKLRLSD